MDVTVVTTNEGKVREIRALLAPAGIRVRFRRRALLEPQSDSLEEVVRTKLRQLPRTWGTVLVEDSGLFIDALDGFPGVYSAHIYGLWKFDRILELLRRRPRGAAFRTVAGVRRGGKVRLFEGECRGEIVRTPRGAGGFGFDPVFRPIGSHQTFAEMSVAEKSAFSHRARAVGQVARWLTGPGHGPRPRASGEPGARRPG